MSSRGKRAPLPPPLPMYQPVVLKHVPTMVRRKYDHIDILTLNPDAPTDEQESEDDDEYSNSSHLGMTSEDGGDGDRSDDECSACISDSYVKDEAQENVCEEPSYDHGLQENEDTDLQNSNSSIEVDAGVSFECQHSGEENPTDDCDIVTNNSESVGNENIQPTDSELECRETEDCGSTVVNHVVDSNLEDEIQHKTELSNELGSPVEHNIGEDDGAVDAKTPSPTYSRVQDEASDMTEVNSANEQELYCEDNKGECGEVEDGNPASCAHTHVNGEAEETGNKCLDDRQDTVTQMHNNYFGHENFTENSLHSGDLKSEDDGTNDMSGTIVKYARDATEFEKDTHCDSIGKDNGAGDAKPAPSFKDDALDMSDMTDRISLNEQDLQSENIERVEDQPRVYNDVPILDSNLEDEIHEERLSDFSNVHGFPVGDSIGEDKGAEEVSTPTYPCVKDALDMTEKISEDEQGLCSRENKGECDEAEDGNPTLCANASVDSEAERIECGSIIDRQDTPTIVYNEDFGPDNFIRSRKLCSGENKGECDEAEDGNPTVLANASVDSEAERIGCGSLIDQQDTPTIVYNEDFGRDNFIRNRSLNLTDLKSEGDGTKDMNATVDKYTREATEVQEESHSHSGKEQEFNPEAFKKAVKEDGYELYCPYCKQSITNTLIYQRRENSQHCRITCFTSLIALFCCIRE